MIADSRQLDDNYRNKRPVRLLPTHPSSTGIVKPEIVTVNVSEAALKAFFLIHLLQSHIGDFFFIQQRYNDISEKIVSSGIDILELGIEYRQP